LSQWPRGEVGLLKRRGIGALLAAVLATTCHAEGFYPGGTGDSKDNSGWAATIDRSPIIIPGTGQVVGSPAKGATVTQEQGDITLNFVDADINEVTRAVLGDVLGLNYVLSPKVEGNVTIRTSRPLSREAVLPAFEAILRVHGAAIVQAGDVYQVVPAAEAPRAAPGSVTPRKSKLRSRGYGVEVVPLKFIGATEMEKVLKPVAPEGSILYVDTTRNLLLFGGMRDERENLMRMVDIFDVDFMRGMSFALFPLEHSDANTVAAELERIFSLNTAKTANKESPSPPEGSGSVRFLPIERLRAVLVISPEMVYINHAREWIKTLDRRDEAGQSLHVYHVQNGRAKDIAAVLGSIFGAEEAAAQPTRGEVAPGYRPVAIESAIDSALGLPAGGRTPAASATPGRVSQAPPAKTSATRPITTESQDVTVVQFSAQAAVRIVADPNINALVIYASPADYETILSALGKIDIAPLQVLIEATIAEVTLTGSFEYGLQWFFSGLQAQADTTGNKIFDTIGPGLTGFAGAFSYLVTMQDLRVALTALSQQTDVRIISSPQLMVRDNQPARIQIGDQVPVLTQQAVSTITPGAPVVNSVQYIDAGVILEVTPHVNASGLVSLDISQQISTPVRTETSNIDSPSIQQRMIETSVAVQSGNVVALGGLIADRESKGGQGIPALRRIPVLGTLFGTKGRDSQRTELLVLLTPRIIRDSQEAQDITYEIGTRMRAIVPLGAKIQ
jgi:general secretion pathway protein D